MCDRRACRESVAFDLFVGLLHVPQSIIIPFYSLLRVVGYSYSVDTVESGEIVITTRLTVSRA